MDFKIIGIMVGVYLIVLPILFRLLFAAHTKLIVNRAIERSAKTKAAQKNLPKPLWPQVSQRIKFVFKDNRSVQLGKKTVNIQNRHMFFALWGIGLVAFIITPIISMWTLLAVGVTFFFSAMIFGNFATKSLLETRKKVIDRMFTIGRVKLNIPPEYEDNPNAVVEVKEWAEFVKPTKAEFKIPDTFAEEGAEGFLKQFNQIFGTERTWIPSNDPETGTPGWDFENGKVTIHAVPPLPQKATWNEHYVLSPGVAWSFFPIALGVENGLELPNPKTGEVENILGFDLSGEAPKEAAKHGLKISGNIAVSPMALVGGGTGGGKSLSLDTNIFVKDIVNKDFSN